MRQGRSEAVGEQLDLLSALSGTCKVFRKLLELSPQRGPARPARTGRRGAEAETLWRAGPSPQACFELVSH